MYGNTLEVHVKRIDRYQRCEKLALILTIESMGFHDSQLLYDLKFLTVT